MLAYDSTRSEANACTFRLSFHTRRSTRCTVRYHGTFFSSCSVRNHDYSKRQLTRRSTSAGSSTTSSGGQISTVTDTLTWLRGIVQTNEDGIAECETIVPERCLCCTDENDQYTVVHTSQVFFEDSLYNQIAVTEPYIQDSVTCTLTADNRVYAADTTAVLDVSQDDSNLSGGNDHCCH
ncbi:TPA: hypothetical protein ACH3X1_004096 [Trebouxia sp. C0004]